MNARSTVENRDSTIACPLRTAARSEGDRTAIASSERAITFSEWDDLAARVAGRLRNAGLRSGDRAAILAERDWRFLVLMLACWRAGLVMVPLSTHLPRAALRDATEQVQAKLLLTDRVAEFTEVDLPTRSMERLYANLEDEAARVDGGDWSLDAPASIVFTTGSTGRPKAALHSVRNHIRSAEGANANMPLAPGDRWLLALPLYHVGGLGVVVRCLLARATVVLPEPARSLGELIAGHQISHVSVVPTQVRRLFDEASPATLGTLKAMLIGGAPLQAPLLERAHARGWPLFTTYGLTEMTSQVTTTPPGAPRERLRSAGAPLPYREVKLAESGEILVRGETLFRGYVDRAELDPARDAEGWFHTRDLGRMDGRGDLHVAGRLDHQFISGGENIQPEAIEAALCQLSGVLRAIVVPVPDAEYGQRPVAFVETKTDTFDPGRLGRALQTLLPSFMVPDAFHAWPDGLTGMKVRRSHLIQEAQKLQGR